MEDRYAALNQYRSQGEGDFRFHGALIDKYGTKTKEWFDEETIDHYRGDITEYIYGKDPVLWKRIKAGFYDNTAKWNTMTQEERKNSGDFMKDDWKRRNRIIRELREGKHNG